MLLPAAFPGTIRDLPMGKPFSQSQLKQRALAIGAAIVRSCGPNRGVSVSHRTRERLMPNLRKFVENNSRALLGTASVLIFLLAWETASVRYIDPMFVSAPTLILAAGKKVLLEGEIWRHLLVSSIELGLGFGLAIAMGIPLGVVLGWYKTWDSVLNPFVYALYVTPRVALIGILILWFGIGIWSTVAVVFLSAVFPILVNTQTGVQTVDADLLKAARCFNATDLDIFLTVALPWSVPYILTGLRLGIGRALIGVVVGELFASSAGIGFFIIDMASTFQTDKMFFGVIVLSGAAILLTEIVRQAEVRFEKWRVRTWQ